MADSGWSRECRHYEDSKEDCNTSLCSPSSTGDMYYSTKVTAGDLDMMVAALQADFVPQVNAPLSHQKFALIK